MSDPEQLTPLLAAQITAQHRQTGETAIKIGERHFWITFDIDETLQIREGFPGGAWPIVWREPNRK